MDSDTVSSINSLLLLFCFRHSIRTSLQRHLLYTAYIPSNYTDNTNTNGDIIPGECRRILDGDNSLHDPSHLFAGRTAFLTRKNLATFSLDDLVHVKEDDIFNAENFLVPGKIKVKIKLIK